jgi:hypothetical protein
MLIGWLTTAGFGATRVLRSLPDPGVRDRRRKGPLVSITPATANEADSLEADLKHAFLVRRVGSQIHVNDAPGHDAPLSAVLQALEDCLTHHRLAGIRLTMDGRRYVMYPAEDA